MDKVIEPKSLRSFRLEDELWEKFKEYCHNNKTDASKAIKAYIESVVSDSSNDKIIKSSNNTDLIDRIDKQDAVIASLTERLEHLEKEWHGTK